MPLHVVDHPLIVHKLAILRDKATSVKKFREVVNEITLLLAYEATCSLPMDEVEIETPLCRTRTRMLKPGEVVVAPILRAGLGMMPGMLDILPMARVAHIGLRRDEHTHLPVTYYMNMPTSLNGANVLVVDPMLATAGSMCAAIDLLKNAQPASITAICLIASPEGEQRMNKSHPDVSIYVGAMDERLNEKAYIVPGLGDAGDRMFGTA
ncbi:uracil phosphoribosyltransferase [Candidatus Sumerlaeota bacterium]|nr:uracil phosphoribosyltransferase [Candidatus Sumerlaeota bacterium]